MYAGDGSGQLGAWYNNWGDLWGDIKSGVAAVTGGGSGVNTSPIPSPGGIYSSDLAIVRAWADQARADGTIATRMPSGAHSEVVNHITYDLGAGSSNAGKLAARQTGPGTWYPAETKLVYELAPANVLAADVRIQGGLASDQTGALLDAMKALGLAPGLDGNNPTNQLDQLKTYLLWAGVGVAAIVILPGRRR